MMPYNMVHSNAFINTRWVFIEKIIAVSKKNVEIIELIFNTYEVLLR